MVVGIKHNTKNEHQTKTIQKQSHLPRLAALHARLGRGKMVDDSLDGMVCLGELEEVENKLRAIEEVGEIEVTGITRSL